jgi:hypothetical protein
LAKVKTESKRVWWETLKALASRAWFRWAKILVNSLNAVLAIGGIAFAVVLANQPDKKFLDMLSSPLYVHGIIAFAVLMFVLNVIDALTDVGLEEIRKRLVASEKSQREAEEARTLADRQRNNAVKDLRDYFEANLRVLAQQMHFQGDERISVYEFKEGGFGLIGRYSMHHERRKPGRPIYSLDQGIVGLAWEGKEAFVDDLPDPATDLDGYCSAVEALHGLPADVVRSLRMKSRTLSGHLILDALGDGPVAVIVFESMRPGAFTRQAIEEAFGEHETLRMKYYLEQRRPQPWRHHE